MARKTKSLKERLEAKIDKRPDGCWIFTGALSKGGYGKIKDTAPARGNVPAHRAAWREFVGPIPEGKHLDHLCKNRACVNPKHLEPVTPEENWRRGDSMTRRNALKTHCKEGHPLSGDNLYVAPGDPTRRKCRICLAVVRQRRLIA